MKTFVLALAAAGLSGCAVYPAPAPYGPYAAGAPAYVGPPVYLYGAGVYRYGGYPSPYFYPAPTYYSRGYHHGYPGGFSGYGARPYLHAPHPGIGARGPGGINNGFGYRSGRPGRR